jgi:hypothetical protein
MLVNDGYARFWGGGIVLTGVVRTQFCIVVLGLWAAVLGVDVNAQTQRRVLISVSSVAEIRIRIDSLPPSRSWSFRNAYAGVLGIAERVSEFQGFSATGVDVRAKQIATGEFRSEVDATAVAYLVKLPPPRASDASHVSWLVGESGFLMLADLLPEELSDVFIEFSLPAAWSSAATIKPDTNGTYHVVEPEQAIFFVGCSLRRQSKQVDGVWLDSVLDGKWSFKDTTVLNVAGKVMQKYLALTGFRLPSKPVVMIAPLPLSAGSVKWRAETRGSTVVLLMDPQAKIENWAGQLGVIFTHELLHLWVPNSLRLEGEYDWFFEGFTLYTALVTALELKFINFDEYLATLARVYDSYLSRADGLSLIEASERRWTTGNSAVYDKGMLVAFLYDLNIARESGGRNRLADRYRDLFQRPVSGPASANEAIIKLLSSTSATADLAKRYIEGSNDLELEAALSSYGLRLDTTGKNSTLRVDKELHADQKRLLKSLGYR